MRESLQSEAAGQDVELEALLLCMTGPLAWDPQTRVNGSRFSEARRTKWLPWCSEGKDTRRRSAMAWDLVLAFVSLRAAIRSCEMGSGSYPCAVQDTFPRRCRWPTRVRGLGWHGSCRPRLQARSEWTRGAGPGVEGNPVDLHLRAKQLRALTFADLAGEPVCFVLAGRGS